MRIPKRFALSTLLLLMLAVALVFGYAQWRRQSLVQQVAELQSTSYSDLLLIDHWFWPSAPSVVTVKLFQESKDTYIRPPANYSMRNSNLNEGTRYTKEEAEAHFSTVRDKLLAIGVKEVFLQVSNSHLGLEIIEIVE